MYFLLHSQNKWNLNSRSIYSLISVDFYSLSFTQARVRASNATGVV